MSVGIILEMQGRARSSLLLITPHRPYEREPGVSPQAPGKTCHDCQAQIDGPRRQLFNDTAWVAACLLVSTAYEAYLLPNVVNEQVL